MKKFISAILPILLFVSCTTPRTLVTGTWTNPQINKAKNYSNILVATLTDNMQAKATVESDLAEQLREQGVMVSKSMDVFPPNFSENDNKKDSMLRRVKDNGTDAILTVALIDKDTDTRYVPNSTAYNPYPVNDYYGRFWGYYSYRYPQLYSRGYYTKDKIYYFEINLYDTDTENLIWSAQSKTYNPAEISNFSEDFAKLIVAELEEDDILS